MVLSEPETAVMSAPPTIAPISSPPQAQRRPTLMTYGVFILVGCCLCASLVSSLL
jgi:hypothetical protein